MRQCPHCQFPLSSFDNADSCPSCGRSIAAAPAAETAGRAAHSPYRHNFNDARIPRSSPDEYGNDNNAEYNNENDTNNYNSRSDYNDNNINKSSGSAPQGVCDLSVPLDAAIASSHKMKLKQKRELAEALLGWETRNRYSIIDDAGQTVAAVEEARRGFGGALARQFLGTLRTFDISISDPLQGTNIYNLHHEPCWFLNDIDIIDSTGTRIGRLCQRFSVFSRHFDILDARGQLTMTAESPFWHPWTFTFMRNSMKLSVIHKRFPGLFSFLFTDRDDFEIEFSANISFDDRRLILFSAVFIDLCYFERHGGK